MIKKEIEFNQEDFKSFKDSVQLVASNFKFNIENMQWLKMLWVASRKFSKEDLNYGFRKMISMTRKEWDKEFPPYGSTPPIADWIGFFSKGRREREDEENRTRFNKLHEEAKIKQLQDSASATYPDDPEKAQKWFEYLLEQNSVSKSVN